MTHDEYTSARQTRIPVFETSFKHFIMRLHTQIDAHSETCVYNICLWRNCIRASSYSYSD